jgi:hypothetical protein
MTERDALNSLLNEKSSILSAPPRLGYYERWTMALESIAISLEKIAADDE